jgi:hypothetical protein
MNYCAASSRYPRPAVRNFGFERTKIGSRVDLKALSLLID